MVVVISPEVDINHEIDILNQLFEAGLGCYHIRKPEKTYDEHVEYIYQIDATFHNRIVVHLFHELVNEFHLKGIHFQEQKRRETIEINPEVYFKSLEIHGKTISSSFHETDDILNCEFKFDYNFLSPVFSSISKLGYKGRGFDVNHINKTIIGMGGVTSKNIGAFKKLGYKGVGVLGGIWNNEEPVQTFKKIKNFE